MQHYLTIDEDGKATIVVRRDAGSDEPTLVCRAADEDEADRITQALNTRDEMADLLEKALPYLEPFTFSPDITRQEAEEMGQESVAWYQELVAKIRLALVRVGKGVEP